MTTQSENTRRIARNTLMLYGRMLFGMLVSLYTSRVVLNTLGVEDYGIYNVVGGFVAMFSLVSSSLSSAVSRFLTFELGRKDMGRLKLMFSTSLSIHVILALLVILVAETVGLWFLNTRMTIPADRLHAANWVFQASVCSFALGLCSTPFNASIVSHEHMGTFAKVGIMDVMLRLLVVLFIAHSSWHFDRLIVYSLLLVLVSISLQCFYLHYCGRHFEECRWRFSFDRPCWKEMSSFAVWNFIGCTAGLLKGQGVNVLLNIFVGPVLNAARGIADQVNAAICSFSGNFMTALNPQITKSYASDNREYTMSLVERGSRFSFYIMFILALPVLLETDFILKLWLKQYPDHTVNFVRLVLLLSLSEMLSNTLITLQNANGNIRNYQIAVGGMLLMNFPLSYCCLALFVSVCCLVLRLLFLRRMVHLSVRRYVRNVCLNTFTVALAASCLPVLLSRQMEGGWIRFIAVCAASVCCAGVSSYFVGCSPSERAFIVQTLHGVKTKLLG